MNKKRLRDHVSDKPNAKYSDNPELRDRIKESLSVDAGAFGWRLGADIYRGFVTSDLRLRGAEVPALIAWHEAGTVNLKRLAGFEQPDFWRRPRPEPVLAEESLGGGGGTGPDLLSEKELDEYISSRGASGPKFIIYAFDEGALDTKLSAASVKGLEIGLMFRWTKKTLQLTKPEHVVYKDDPIAQQKFLENPVGRHRESADRPAAETELATPVGIGVFYYDSPTRMGLATNLRKTNCLSAKGISGVTFRDRIPDTVWKYVLIHEIGHYFGLCHTDGVERIMFSLEQKSPFTPWTLVELLWLSAEPVFTLEEARSAWDHIIAHVPGDKLATRVE